MYEIVNLEKKDFPSQLLELPQPPKQLSVRGALPNQDSILLCVVGSRRYTSYGKEVCEKIISELAGSNVVIVSGLALGIDAIAHEAAIKAGLHTIAIPGSGLASDVLYPRTNLSLAKKILESGGALLSEFPDDTRAAPYTFPQRNRIMAGLSHGILVIEAEEKSGTLITARLGTEYNKDVFTIPGPLFSRTSSGPNELLKRGAIPVTNGNDILKEWGLDEMDNKNVEKILENCSEIEKNILNILNEPMDKDTLIEKSGLPINEINIVLSTLEIKGATKELMGKIHNNLL